MFLQPNNRHGYGNNEVEQNIKCSCTHLLFILSLAEGILCSSTEGAEWRYVSFCKMTLPGIWRARCLLESPGALPVPMVGGRRSEEKTPKR